MFFPLSWVGFEQPLLQRNGYAGREAKLLASLNHPNIAAIYGGEASALILELVEGDAPHGLCRLKRRYV
jgi:hypothetical protein